MFTQLMADAPVPPLRMQSTADQAILRDTAIQAGVDYLNGMVSRLNATRVSECVEGSLQTTLVPKQVIEKLLQKQRGEDYYTERGAWEAAVKAVDTLRKGCRTLLTEGDGPKR